MADFSTPANLGSILPTMDDARQICQLKINRINNRMSEAAGHKFDPAAVTWLKRDVLLFANSIGCTVDELQFVYELHPNFQVFPTYPIILSFKRDSQEVIDFYAAQAKAGQGIPGAPKNLDPKKTVDGERHMTFYKQLPTTSEGRKFHLQTTILGVYDKGKPGTVVESQNDLIDADSGEVYTRMISSGFYVGQGNWGGPKGPKSQSFPAPEREPDGTHEQATTPELSHLYRLNGDYNPLHATPEPGEDLGFGGTIAHGLFTYNTACHQLLKLLGGSDAANIKEFAARFASPVKAGDTLVTQVWKTGEKDSEGWEDVRFVTSVKGGKVCLSNGRAKMKVVGQKETRRSKL